MEKAAIWLIKSKDYYGRTAIHYAAMCGSESMALDNIKYLIKAGSDVNMQDRYGRTPAHYAEYDTVIQFLVKKGFKPGIRDENDKTANDLLSSLTTRLPKTTIIDRDEILEKLHTEGRLEHLFTSKNQNILRLCSPQISLSNLAVEIWKNREYAYRNPSSVNLRVRVNEFMSRLLQAVARKDARFENKHVLVGSAREGTKIDDPDEFDIVVILVKFSSMCTVVPAEMGPKGFVHLKRMENFITKPMCCHDFDCFFNSDGFLLTDEVNGKFQICIEEVLEESNFLENEHMFELNLENVGSMSPLTPSTETPRLFKTIRLRLNQSIDDHHTFLKISIDIVPCIHIEWPEYAISDVDPDIKTSGCILVLDQFQSKHMFASYDHSPYARISFAVAESQLIANGPAVAKAAYMVAKQILDKPEHSYVSFVLH